MSAPINDGGPAFPMPDSVYPNGQVQVGTYGMTLRDWFAGQERLAEWDDQGSIPGRAMCEALAGRPMPEKGWSGTAGDMLKMLKWEADWRSALKYIRADAMLKARAAK